MPKKQSSDREGVASYNAWIKMNKKFEAQGLHGTDYYVKRVEQLEAKVKRLEKKLKATKITQEMEWEE
jgi:hypothetical protein